MRFIFAGDVVNVNYVKRRLDGEDNDPAFSQKIGSEGWFKYAWLDDRNEQTGTHWDRDAGIKNYPGCEPNYGHMRVYAQTEEDHNYSPKLGNYVIASIHVDQERRFRPGWRCDTRY
jgi:hypothetical protein